MKDDYFRKVEDIFSEHYGSKDRILINAPGRVNLIGGHTDYNEGFVLPAAIDKSIALAMAPNQDRKIRLHSIDKNEFFETELSASFPKSNQAWVNYLLGVVDRLQNHGYSIQGFDCVFGGNIPIGAGLSSSAALEGGVTFGLNHLFDLGIDTVEMARIAQEAENKFVGVQCGIMDQFISLNGKEDHAMKLDCRSLEYEHYPFDLENICIVVCDTQVRHDLASSEYNIRREQCEEGVEILQQYDSSIKALRDVPLRLLQEHKDEFSPEMLRRCRYIIEENQRVLQACEDLDKGDLAAFGKKMFAAHAGLRDEYNVSCEELDILIDLAQQFDGVIGARMMGGGFGGCTINLVKEDKLDTFSEYVQEEYAKKNDKSIKMYITKVSGGTMLINKIIVANK